SLLQAALVIQGDSVAAVVLIAPGKQGHSQDQRGEKSGAKSEAPSRLRATALELGDGPVNRGVGRGKSHARSSIGWDVGQRLPER
ncbi:MAG: hypothetical protein WD120_02325, partial [Gemmatimonadota bacterium]